MSMVAEMAETICEQYPCCPAREARQIASHTARRGSGRVGRSAAGRKLHDDAIRLAVVAYIRHEHTRYDELLMSGAAREAARRTVAANIDQVLVTWRGKEDALLSWRKVSQLYRWARDEQLVSWEEGLMRSGAMSHGS